MAELERPDVDEYRNATKFPIVIVLDDIRSLYNIGSVFRTADAFNVERVVLCGITATPPHREIQKTALGATESVAWEHVRNAAAAVRSLKETGYQVIGVEQVVGSTSLERFQFKRDKPTVLIFGNEVKGVSQEVLNLCDGFIEIPQFGTKHSINVSVSVGVVLWHYVAFISAK